MKKTAATLVFCAIAASTVFATGPNISLRVLGSYASGLYNQGAAEIVAHDPHTQRLFVVNGAGGKIDVLDIANPITPTLLFSIDLAPYGRQANSVDVHKGVVAVAVEAVVKTDPGKVVFFDAHGNFLNAVTVGALPDMLTFTPDGRKLLVANEGEPSSDYAIDPPGSISIINVRRVTNATVTTAGFEAYDDEILDPSIRIFGPNASVSEDLEPEYIAVSPDSDRAFITLQENNALAVLNLKNGRIVKLVGLGFSDHSRDGFGMDSSDRLASNTPGVAEILPRPVHGMYQPDGLAAFQHRGRTLLISANEGDAREYPGALVEEARINSLTLDPFVFPNAAFLRTDPQIGRLNVTRSLGNFDADAEYEGLFTFGTRSFSIWTTGGGQIFDSGDDIEQITKAAHPLNFNASNTNNTLDDRSDNKGPEPEGVTTGKVCGVNFAFIGLERIGGVLVYDLSNPNSPRFVQYINNRNFSAATNTAAALDLGPEGLTFIKRRNSPIDQPLLVVANEISGTTTIYAIDRENCGRRGSDDDEDEDDSSLSDLK